MIRFKTATPLNAQEIASLVNSAYRGEYSQQGWTTEASLLDGQRTDAESLQKLINSPLNQIEIAYEGESESIIASVHLIQELPDTLYFGMLTVEPRAQAKGLGKIILQHVESVAISYGFKRIRFTVIPTRTELVAFYERRGFKATGNFEPFPEQDPKFGMPKVEGLILREYDKQIQANEPI
jgi:GNAT superfamily N-acetyltransferase